MNIVNKILEDYNEIIYGNKEYRNSIWDDVIHDLIIFKQDLSDDLNVCSGSHEWSNKRLKGLNTILKIDSLLYKMYRDEIFWNTLNEIKEELELLNEHHQS